MSEDIVLIVGVGPGLGAALGRRFAKAGAKVALAARRLAPVQEIAKEYGASAYACDATDEQSVLDLYAAVERDLGTPTVVVYNASGRVRGSVLDIEVEQFKEAWERGCLGGFIVAREAGRRMVPAGKGTILFTGATASVKSYAQSAGFAVGKFGLRALSFAMARDLGPKGIHVAHVIVDGGIHGPHHAVEGGKPEHHLLEPDAIAETYYQLHAQHKSAWAAEIDLRPWVEKF
jgi:NAD(P)-dependent dehydrogenase (short-subunit alcohol dehydrogenase family)